MTQVSLWFSILINSRLVSLDSAECIFELCRRVLEACGWRMSLDCVLIFLVGAKGGQCVAQGIGIDQLNFALEDLYVKPPIHSSLSTYWRSNPPNSEVAVKRTLQQITQLEVGSMLILALLQELTLFIADLEQVKPWIRQTYISAIIWWIEHHCIKQANLVWKQAYHEQSAFTSSCFDLKGISGEAEMSKAFWDPTFSYWLRQPRGAKGGRHESSAGVILVWSRQST